VRYWHKLSLILPLGVALAAVYVPLRFTLAGAPLPMAVQAAVEAPARQTAHFFPGDVRLSGFQRLIMPEGTLPSANPSQPVEVTAPAEPPPAVSQANFEAPAVPQPAPAPLWEEPEVKSPHYFATTFTLEIEQQETATTAKRLTPAGVTTAAAPKIVEPPQPAAPARVAESRQLAQAPQPVEAPLAKPAAPAPEPTSTPEPTPTPKKVVWDSDVRQVPHFFPSVSAGVANLRTASFQQPAAPLPQPKSAEIEVAAKPKAEPPQQLVAAKLPELPSQELPANEPPAPQIPMIKWDDQALRNPHYFLGSMRLASLDRTTAIAAPPLKQVAVEPAFPLDLPQAPLAPPLQIPATPQIAAAPQVEIPREQPMFRNEPLLGSAESRLQRTAVAAIVPNDTVSIPKPQLASLLPAGQPRPVPLMAAEVLPAAKPVAPRDEFQLTSLQLQPGLPGPNLQPTEVVPIPTPTNPTMSRNPYLDADRPIGSISTKVLPPTGKLPTDLAANQFRGEYPAYLPRGWEENVYFWDAPSMCIGPLRYEEVNLERYGYSHCVPLQPVMSGLHFLGSTLALPYSMTVRHPGSCVYPLGHYRPGSPAPYRHIWPEARPVAASVECLTIAGLILLIP
jgi:hypothetical protein